VPTTTTPTGWRLLLEAVLPILDGSRWSDQWTLGGGTGLALHLDHRASDDVDLFFTDARALRAFAPGLNPAVRAICRTWQYPGHYIKLERDDGEIDFLVAAPQTDLEPVPVDVGGGRTIRVDQPGEILARKLRYRGSQLKARDVFDLAAVAELAPDQAEAALAALDDGSLRRLVDRVRRMEEVFRAEVARSVRPTAAAESLVAACVPVARDTLLAALTRRSSDDS
jgi:hypothetical protein